MAGSRRVSSWAWQSPCRRTVFLDAIGSPPRMDLESGLQAVRSIQEILRTKQTNISGKFSFTNVSGKKFSIGARHQHPLTRSDPESIHTAITSFRCKHCGKLKFTNDDLFYKCAVHRCTHIECAGCYQTIAQETDLLTMAEGLLERIEPMLCAARRLNTTIQNLSSQEQLSAGGPNDTVTINTVAPPLQPHPNKKRKQRQKQPQPKVQPRRMASSDIPQRQISVGSDDTGSDSVSRHTSNASSTALKRSMHELESGSSATSIRREVILMNG